MAEKFIVKREDKLLNFLFSVLNSWAKKRVKERLKQSNILVNGKVVTKHDFALKPQDIVEIKASKKIVTKEPIRELDILYKDDYIIAINKPYGLLSVATAKENKLHALSILREQLNRNKKRNSVKIFPVHRLDRDTSGVLLFATSKDIREQIMSKWEESKKLYLAIVQGKLKESSGTINQPLRLDDKIYKVHVGRDKFAKRAVTHYKVIKTNKKRTLLEVKIDTGRQHQIRAHLSWLGNPIIGDERYGIKGEKLGLHAKYLKIYHPKKGFISFEVDAPKEFYSLID